MAIFWILDQPYFLHNTYLQITQLYVFVLLYVKTARECRIADWQVCSCDDD